MEGLKYLSELVANFMGGFLKVSRSKITKNKIGISNFFNRRNSVRVTDELLYFF